MKATTKRYFRALLVGLAVLTLVMFGLAGFIAWTLDKPVNVKNEEMVFIPLDTPLQAALDSVSAHVDFPAFWLVELRAQFMARVQGRTIQSGWYTFTSKDTQNDILDILFSGERRSTVRVTIPEGLTYKEIAALVAEQVESDSAAFVEWCENPDNIAKYTPEAPSMEGFLMPDTYQFFWKTDGGQIAQRLAEEWQRRIGSKGAKLEDVTLASIVEAEAVVSKEMPTIAGVYTNRIAKGMKLEADPTVQYALGSKRRLLYRDLDYDSPYNTYLVNGLPPGPINNPGEAAVKAAQAPAEHEFLFFVAKGDGSGEHLFAKSGTQHVRNVREYRRNRGRF